MKSKKVLVISLLAITSLVVGLTAGVALRNPEQADQDSGTGVSVGMIGVMVCLWAATNSKRQKDKARQDQENGA